MFVAIIGILAAVALPAYQDYTIRAKVSQAILFGNQATMAVEGYYQKNGSVPLRLEDAGISSVPGSNFVQLAQVDPGNGSIQVVLAVPPVEGKSVHFIPSVGPDKRVTWRCASHDIPAKYLPQQCR